MQNNRQTGSFISQPATLYVSNPLFLDRTYAYQKETLFELRAVHLTAAIALLLYPHKVS